MNYDFYYIVMHGDINLKKTIDGGIVDKTQ